MKISKIISLNLLIFIIGLLILELIFGSWFKKDSFGYAIRDQRNVKIPISVKYDQKKYNYFFERNDLGFIGDEIDPKEIDVVFLGGSTGEEMFIPPKYRIVDQLNLKLKKDDFDIKIINASKGGKSTRGYVNDFKYWFPKIESFKPKIVIFYIGVNDSALDVPKHFDNVERLKFSERAEDYIKNNSIFYKIKKKIENKYFNNLRKYYGLFEENLYENYNFISYTDAKKLFLEKKIDDQSQNVLNNFSKNLDNLNKIIIAKKFEPIFITQVMFDGVSNHNLFIVNEYLKNFCEKNNYKIIKLDEIIHTFDNGDFYDKVHTTIKGSTKLSEVIYLSLKKILVN